MQANDNFKIIKSARHKSRDRMPQVTQLNELESLTPSSLGGRHVSSSVKKQLGRGDGNRIHMDLQDMINVEIRQFGATPEQDDRVKYQMQAYASPIRYPQTGTTGAAESDSQTQQERKSSHSIRKNAARRQERQEPNDNRMNLKLNPATLYQLGEENKLTLYADNLRLSSQSQRQSMSHSSNLNYSPTTTVEKRSNSQSTNHVNMR